MFLIQPISCIPTVISEKSLATSPSSSDHLTVGFLVRVFNRGSAKENNLPAAQNYCRKCVNSLPDKLQRPLKHFIKISRSRGQTRSKTGYNDVFVLAEADEV